jgi:hypothetical protein
VLASKETKTIVNRVKRKPQIQFKVKGHDGLERGLDSVKNTAKRNNGVSATYRNTVLYTPCNELTRALPGFSSGLTGETGPFGVNRKITYHHSLGLGYRKFPSAARTGRAAVAVDLLCLNKHHALKTYGRVKA